MERIPLTANGLQKLQIELKQLKSVERLAIVQAIEEARAHGDLSENAEYHAAREQQSFNEARISDLEDKISRAEVIDVSKLSGDTVKFGATVVLEDQDTDETLTYQIVGEEESDIKKGLLSISAPLARALIGKKNKDYIDVKTPRGQKNYYIQSVSFI